MKYKYYTATIACRDNRTRTLTITTDATDNEEMKHIDLTSVQVQMSTNTDPLAPLRPQSGKITIVCNDGISPLDFMPSNYKSHKVEIMRGDVCEFYGYINCETRTQTYPSEGEEFDISIISPLGLAESIRFEVKNPLSPHNIHSNELDDVFWLVTDGYLACGGSTEGKLYSTERFTEKIPRYCSLEDSGDKTIDNDNILRPAPPVGKTYAEILSNIAVFYGITFIESGRDLIAIDPVSHSFIWYCSLTATTHTEFNYYSGVVSAAPAQLAYGSQSIENPPATVTVNCDLDAPSNLLDFSEDNLYRPLPIKQWTDYDFDIQAIISLNNRSSLGMGITKMSATSINGNMTANTLATSPLTAFDKGGSWCILGDRQGSNDLDRSAPTGLALVSSSTEEDWLPEVNAGSIRSKSYIGSNAKELFVKFTVASMLETTISSHTGTRKEYLWHPCNVFDGSPSSGHVEIRIVSTNWTSAWTRCAPMVHEVTDEGEVKYAFDDISCVDCSTRFALPSGVSSMNTTVEFRCIHGINQSNKKCTKIFIYNIELSVSYKDTSRRVTRVINTGYSTPQISSGTTNHAMPRYNIAPEAYKALAFTNFKYSEPTGYNGEDYVVNIPFSVSRPEFYSVYLNGIFDAYGSTYGSSLYEKEYLDRIFWLISRPRITLDLPTVITQSSAIGGGCGPLVYHNDETYLLTGYSRDYMTGIDTISITKIS